MTPGGAGARELLRPFDATGNHGELRAVIRRIERFADTNFVKQRILTADLLRGNPDAFRAQPMSLLIGMRGARDVDRDR